MSGIPAPASERPYPVPAVSIGMPVYNGEAYVDLAITAILQQSFTDFELIICDNASSDATAGICLGHAARDRRVRYLRNPRNLGAGPNFDRCFREARGEFFQWAAHDDLFAPDYLERTVAALRADPAAVLCTVGIVEIDADGHALRRYMTPLSGMDQPDPVRRFAAVIHTRHQCEDFFGLYRRAALEGTALINTFSGSDRVLLAEVALRGRWVRLAEPLFYHREHARRATRALLLVDRKRAAQWQDTSSARPKFGTLFHCVLYAQYWQVVRRNVAPAARRGPYLREMLAWWFTDEHLMDVVRDVLQGLSPNLLHWARATKHALVGAKSPTAAPGSLPTLKP